MYFLFSLRYADWQTEALFTTCPLWTSEHDILKTNENDFDTNFKSQEVKSQGHIWQDLDLDA